MKMKEKSDFVSGNGTGHRVGHLAGADGGESVALMEPMLIGDDAKGRAALSDLAVDLAAKAAGFRRSLPDGMLSTLADAVRNMDCYYSNLIEGHDTDPVDIEKALNNDYSADPKKRDLQLEAKAHVAVQRWIDEGGLTGRATSLDGLLEVHKRFCEHLPESLLTVRDPTTNELIPVILGEIRARDVMVGRHLAVSPGAVRRFLERFEKAYSKLGTTQGILSAAAAHHRLVWIHPFTDGNGRVARLMSHAMLLQQLDTGGVWSIARGLARRQADYKRHLAACDMTRRNDLDGRGNLSQEALVEFTKFFLEICIDQVSFMEQLMQPDRLRSRLMLWAEEEMRIGKLPQKAAQVLEAVLYRGELPRAELATLLGVTDRQARRIASDLSEYGIIVSESARAPWRLAFPATLAPRLMPGLFPE